MQHRVRRPLATNKKTAGISTDALRSVDLSELSSTGDGRTSPDSDKTATAWIDEESDSRHHHSRCVSFLTCFCLIALTDLLILNNGL
jgi:hypothetical protein